MELYILKKEDGKYIREGFIDNAESVLWNKKYNDVGECEIYIHCNVENVNILKSGNYVYRSDDEMFCKIETVEIETDVENGDYIIATAYDIVKLLGGRIVRREIAYSGTVYNFIKNLVMDNAVDPAEDYRKIDKLIFVDTDASALNDTIEMNVFTADLLETIKTVCKTYGYGFKITYNSGTDQLEFRVYKGSDKSGITNNEYVEFSPSYSNILSSRYKEDESNYKNIAYVSYKDDDDLVVLKSVYDTTKYNEQPIGEDRKEVFVDGTGVNREIDEETLFQIYDNVSIDNNVYYNDEGEIVGKKSGDKVVATDKTYLLLLDNLALNKLAEHNKTQEFTGEIDTIDTYEYKTDYDLGDIVKVINEHGISSSARITEIMESDDDEDGHVIEPVFENFS